MLAPWISGNFPRYMRPLPRIVLKFALFCSAMVSSLKIVNHFFFKPKMITGADPMALNCHGKSAVDVAASQELKDRLLYEYRGHCLLEACRQADLSKAKKYLSSSSNSSAAVAELLAFKHPYTGDSAVHCAVTSPFPKRKSVVEMLYRKGGNLNDKNKEFLTPLHLSADKSHYDVIDVLLKLRAKV